MNVMGPDNKAPVFDALHIPPAAVEQGGVEVLRAVIIDGALHVSLRRAFDEPEPWGMLVADVVRHVSRLYAMESKLTEEHVLHRVMTLLLQEMENPTDPGTTSAIS